MAGTRRDLRGSTILVTGATGGLGGAIARALDARGGRLIVTGRRADLLKTLATGLRSADAIPCDLANRSALDDLVERVTDVDVLVANAALPGAGLLSDFTTEQIDRALDVNLRAPIVLARRLAPLMQERGRGHLVFVSSMGAKLPASRLSVYGATKSGLRSFAACVRQELHDTGVGVSVVFPGSVHDVGMWADSGAVGTVATVSSQAVAAGVVRAIEQNKAEVDVAPWSLRAFAVVAHVAPDLFASISRRAGADKQTAALAEGLRDRR